MKKIFVLTPKKIKVRRNRLTKKEKLEMASNEKYWEKRRKNSSNHHATNLEIALIKGGVFRSRYCKTAGQSRAHQKRVEFLRKTGQLWEMNLINPNRYGLG